MICIFDTFYQVNMQLGVHVVYVSFIEDILKCVVKHIATDLCFKTNYTLVMACAQKQHN